MEWLRGADTTYVHPNTSTDDELAMIKRSGGSASVAPYVEMLMGHAHPPISRLLEQGVTPSLSIDVATSVPGDMFIQMRTALAQGRISAFGDDVDAALAPTLAHTDVLGFATLVGARACGLGDRVGTRERHDPGLAPSPPMTGCRPPHSAPRRLP